MAISLTLLPDSSKDARSGRITNHPPPRHPWHFSKPCFCHALNQTQNGFLTGASLHRSEFADNNGRLAQS